jgi:hypothetical protein
VSVLVERICDEWLSKSTEQQASLLAGEELQKEQKKQKPREPEAPGTADVRYQLKLYEAAQKAAGKAEKDAIGSAEAKGDETAATQPCPNPEAPRPSFAERRSEQKKCTCKVKLVWTTCKGPGAFSVLRGDTFRNRERAEIAAAEFKACHGWTPFIALCELCSAFHLYRVRPLVTEIR